MCLLLTKPDNRAKTTENTKALVNEGIFTVEPRYIVV